MDMLAALENVDDLPTIPTTLTKVLQVTNRDDTTVADLGKVVIADPPLAAKLLRLANSAYFGLMRQVSDINRAIAMLGFEEVRSLAISVSTFDSVCVSASSDGLFDRTVFWEHSFVVAYVARKLGKTIGLDVEHAFAAGLLHDIGKTLLDRYFPEAFVKVITEMKQSGATFYEVERRLGQTSHDVLGGFLLEKWGLPPELVAGASGHHAPEKGHSKTVSLIFWANALAHVAGFAPGAEERKLTLEQVFATPAARVLSETGQLPEVEALQEVLRQLDDDAESISGQAAMLF